MNVMNNDHGGVATVVDPCLEGGPPVSAWLPKGGM